jgi:hypothetical protein
VPLAVCDGAGIGRIEGVISNLATQVFYAFVRYAEEPQTLKVRSIISTDFFSRNVV